MNQKQINLMKQMNKLPVDTMCVKRYSIEDVEGEMKKLLQLYEERTESVLRKRFGFGKKRIAAFWGGFRET